MTKVHPNALKHGLSEGDVVRAWEGYYVGAVRVPGERKVRLGIDGRGRELEMVGALLEGGEWLVYHALTPPTQRMRKEIDDARRRK